MNTAIYTPELNSRNYECLNRLQIAKLTSHPTPGVLYSLQSNMSPKQAFNAQRLVTRLRGSKGLA